MLNKVYKLVELILCFADSYMSGIEYIINKYSGAMLCSLILWFFYLTDLKTLSLYIIVSVCE
jgi:hypothetical protein